MKKSGRIERVIGVPSEWGQVACIHPDNSLENAQILKTVSVHERFGAHIY
ncbi:hypothetical protein J2TS6_39190 [Paenibacillus albilobatus]|uniref:Uncharacterized protein n=1 Tax=Paenibacillus albilobatus TaxID=2716884 RepID=A0A919XMA2_9BACL|nr:hypothetical protein J2TS6_39190 [Paenibacillus albilobatus]